MGFATVTSLILFTCPAGMVGYVTIALLIFGSLAMNATCVEK